MWCQADDGNWTWVEDTKFGDSSIRALAWGRTASGDRYVAGGDDPSGNGKLCWSGDGITWTYCSTTISKRVNGLAFGNGVFIAVSDDGKIYLSDNGGETWTAKHTIPSGTGLLSVVYGSGTFIAAGHNGVALASKDGGISWTPMTVSFSTDDQISCAAYVGGRFILAGNPYSGGNSRIAGVYIKPAVQTDVEVPFNLATGDNQITITFNDGAFKKIPVADDFDLSKAGFRGGIIWWDPQKPLEVIFKGITVSSPGNGKTITIRASVLSEKAVSATVKAEKKLTWTVTQDTKFGTSNIRGIAYGDKKYVAVGAGKIAISYNGVTWEEVSTGGKPWEGNNDYVDFQGIVYGDDKFIAVGYWVNGDSGNGWGVAAVSTDGTNWTMKDKILTTGSDSANIYAIAWTSQNFVAVGRSGRSATSQDGNTWTMQQVAPFDNKDIFAVASGGGKVVIGGAEGKLAFSPDNGSNWTWVANNFFGTDKAISTITFNSNSFIAAGDGGNMKIAASDQIIAGTGSDGGNNWQYKDSKFGGTGIRALASGGGKIIAVGHNGKMSESTDGSDWTALEVGVNFGQSGFTTEEQIACIVYGDSRFVIGGNVYNSSGNVSKIAYSNNQ
jgi:photosystem II stability/assembly factor-like uncharacterized protein